MDTPSRVVHKYISMKPQSSISASRRGIHALSVMSRDVVYVSYRIADPEVYALRGGFKAWQRAGLPVDPLPKENPKKD